MSVNARWSIDTQGDIEDAFIQRFGTTVGEVMQRLVTDEVLHQVDARHIHRLLATNDKSARDVVMKLEQAGGSSSRKAVRKFRRDVIRLFERQLPHHLRPGSKVAKSTKRINLQVSLPLIKKNHKLPILEPARSDVPVIESVCHHLACRVAELQTTEINRPRVVLVGRGKYNPIHKMHLRQFVIARQYLEEHTKLSVLGGLLVPKHATEVRQRCRTRPQEIIPPRHRLAMARVAIGGSPWLTVDSWEITRRRILDYLSTLDHVRQLFEQRFPDLSAPVRFVLLVGPDQLLRLNLDELRDSGHECITICRPQEHERLLAQMGTRWRHFAHVVEDNALLSTELESTSSSKLRQALISGRVQAATSKVPRSVMDYIKCHRIPQKMSGLENWTNWDKQFADGEGEEDRGYRSNPRKVSNESTAFIKI